MTNSLVLSVLPGCFLALLVISVAADSSSLKLPCEFRDSLNISSGARDARGHIRHNGIEYEPKHYALINYDYDALEQRVATPSYYYRGCVCQLKSCVRLCCPLGEYLSITEDHVSKCVNTSFSETPFEVWANVGAHQNDTQFVNLFAQANYGFVYRKPCTELFVEDQSEWHLDDTGSLFLEGFIVPQNEYCLSTRQNVSSAIAYICPGTQEETRVTVSIGLMISIPFLLVTLFIYGCVSELRNIHGKSLICYVLALTCTYMVLLQLNMKWHNHDCYVSGYLFYFWALVSFFWLNVMCFDIFWTFSSGVVIKNERKRFLYYSLYAWGFPLLFTATLIVADFTDLLPPAYRPGIDNSRCFLQREMLVEFIYFYSVVLLLVVANVYFFVVTAVRIIRIQRATEAALQNDSRRHSKFEKDRYRFSLYLRLFVVMGITWTFELISWGIGKDYDYIFYVTDICNCLLGVIIFFLFVWKKKVRQLALKRIGIQRTRSEAKSASINTGYTSTLTKGASEGIPMRGSTDS